MKERTQTRCTNVIAFRESLIVKLPQQNWKVKARKERVKIENDLSLTWKQKSPGNKYEIPYKFSKTQNLRREMAAVQYTVKKHLLESSLHGSDRNHVTSTSLSWTNKLINKEINFAGLDKEWEIPHKNVSFYIRYFSTVAVHVNNAFTTGRGKRI